MRTSSIWQLPKKDESDNFFSTKRQVIVSVPTPIKSENLTKEKDEIVVSSERTVEKVYDRKWLI